ncbi:Ppx/GppA phosphatase family protein [Sandaracinobacteroides hominis]|uniref:Ppx/GppA phosphatase family protein n=1 Tax=Sandaracinobacteroides hominis TaxID=2780086 RepID=UPI0018F6BCCC|nr:Ppx/GppA phosphatase family protein [Sandaracinobacteroides hominis]
MGDNRATGAASGHRQRADESSGPPRKGESPAGTVRQVSAQAFPAASIRSREAPRRATGHHRGPIAALDLGTNNCRLLIARRVGADGDGEFQVIDAFSRIVRLGEGLLQSGRLSDAAMDRAVAALATCADKLARRGVTQVRSVATEACRRASNGPEFVHRVYKETGLALDVITPAEEARLAVIGCQTLIDRKARRTLVFDIGGGSTEVVLLERVNGNKPGRREGGLRMEAWVSVPWGVVSLGETELADAGSPASRLIAYNRMKARVSDHLAPLARRIRGEVQLLGASGTVTTLASLNMGLAHYDRRQVDGSLASTAELIALSHDLAVKSPEDRALIPGVGADRADLVVAGAAILEALIDLGAAPQLRVADRGIREGILRSMIAREDNQRTA